MPTEPRATWLRTHVYFQPPLLLVLFAVTFLYIHSEPTPSLLFAMEGSNVTFKTGFRPSSGLRKVTWYFQNTSQKLAEASQGQTTYYGRCSQRCYLNATNAFLTIPKVGKPDSGTYLVHVTTHQGTTLGAKVILVVYFKLLAGPNVTARVSSTAPGKPCVMSIECSYNRSCHESWMNCTWYTLRDGNNPHRLSGHNPTTISFSLGNGRTPCYLCNASTPREHRVTSICFNNCTNQYVHTILPTTTQRPKTTSRTTPRTTLRTTPKSTTTSKTTTTKATSKPTSRPTPKPLPTTTRKPQTMARTTSSPTTRSSPKTIIVQTPSPPTTAPTSLPPVTEILTLMDIFSTPVLWEVHNTSCSECNSTLGYATQKWPWGPLIFMVFVVLIIIMILLYLYRRRLTTQYIPGHMTMRQFFR
ncbi:membrane protein A45 [Aotine betaherpesvirus 1]|uniref:Membrane protein A45 n=1 Tax=Aotine betaherpesvirus 1 TaxID=50290 RepID=G8XUM3_9BETA|nr:membrane protein A45 [Aotine betaherpesvirus 1]AEV80865.1 membrane protein A45 [Aotine betaherpesvirus 1]